MAGDSLQSDSNALDQTEFHRLFMQGQRRIFGFILTLLPRQSDAEEVFQQSCVVILGKASQFAPGTDFVRWACRIAQYEVYNFRRRLRNERLLFNDELLERISARRLATDELLESELVALKECVEKLSPPDRQIIQSRYSLKTTSRDLAAALGRPANTVYKAIQRIRRRLRECVAQAVGREKRPGPPVQSEEDRP
jgi:RNA polymerase sigma-70 factor (ECF subfamily)